MGLQLERQKLLLVQPKAQTKSLSQGCPTSPTSEGPADDDEDAPKPDGMIAPKGSSRRKRISFSSMFLEGGEDLPEGELPPSPKSLKDKKTTLEKVKPPSGVIPPSTRAAGAMSQSVKGGLLLKATSSSPTTGSGKSVYGTKTDPMGGNDTQPLPKKKKAETTWHRRRGMNRLITLLNVSSFARLRSR